MGNDDRCENCRPSIELEQLKEHFKRETEMSERRLNDHADRIKQLENDGVGTARDIESFKNSLGRIEKSIEKIAESIDKLKEKPSKRWEQVVSSIITVAVSIAVTYFITKK